MGRGREGWGGERGRMRMKGGRHERMKRRRKGERERRKDFMEWRGGISRD